MFAKYFFCYAIILPGFIIEFLREMKLRYFFFKFAVSDANATPSNTPPIDPRAASASGQVIQPATTTPTAVTATTATPTDPTQAQALLQALLTSAVSSAIPATTAATG